MHTEVSVFCRNYGVPDTVADIFYKKKFRYLDDAFFELTVSLHCPPPVLSLVQSASAVFLLLLLFATCL